MHAEIERLKALVAASERRTAQVNAYAEHLAREYERKEKETSALREQILTRLMKGEKADVSFLPNNYVSRPKEEANEAA